MKGALLSKTALQSVHFPAILTHRQNNANAASGMPPASAKDNMRSILRLTAFSLVCFGAALQASAQTFSLHDNSLWLGNRPVLGPVSPEFSIVKDPSGAGVFLRWSRSKPDSLIQAPLGQIAGLRRFTSCHRDEPWWMLPRAGTNCSDAALETQWLLAQTDAGDCVMLVPLMDGPFCFTLSGAADGLNLAGMTGDAAVTGKGGVALFVSVGSDPYKLADAGAIAVNKKLGTGKLRRDKPLPDFVNDFGWCTWNSFYQEVSADKVRTGLASFAAGKVQPRFLILDDGWQDYRAMPGGENRLVSLSANQARFGGDLTPTVQLAKRDFQVRTFIVWHAIIGYWGGVDGKSLPAYGVRDSVRSFSPSILEMHPELNTNWWGHQVGVVPPGQIAKFYDDYHRRLQAQGVDGVKVDTQSMLEGVAAGLGGRVAMTRAYREALESSVNKHFKGRLINCMANSMETYYESPRSTLMRTSIDFWPDKPESHGQHLYCNSQVGLWFGEFMQPDWDMFQSAHPMGAFHAAGRAVSGGPVYVSDTPDAHDFDLLRKLVLSDGTVLRADNVGRPTRDCLFADVTRDPVLLKVFNYNRDCAVIGVFNANYHAAKPAPPLITGQVSPSDAPDLKGRMFAGFAQRSGRVWHCLSNQPAPVSLAEGEWEIISYAPVDPVGGGVAVFGLADKFNSTAAVTQKKSNADGSYTIQLRDGGTFLAWAANAPARVETAGRSVPFTYDTATGRLSVPLSASGKTEVTLRFPRSGTM
jgi:raffinose synthase